MEVHDDHAGHRDGAHDVGADEPAGSRRRDVGGDHCHTQLVDVRRDQRALQVDPVADRGARLRRRGRTPSRCACGAARPAPSACRAKWNGLRPSASGATPSAEPAPIITSVPSAGDGVQPVAGGGPGGDRPGSSTSASRWSASRSPCHRYVPDAQLVAMPSRGAPRTSPGERWLTHTSRLGRSRAAGARCRRGARRRCRRAAGGSPHPTVRSPARWASLDELDRVRRTGASTTRA